ncbi:MAG: isochorismatase family protein [Desulfobacterota bacterium]|nr:isochorismatase family protein [Thermodesulfobacteriota bacterium]
MENKKCLLIVDLQNDFCAGGALAVPDAEAIIPKINQIMDRFDLILASRDMHPHHTTHFQTWPTHCVRGTHGAEFHPDLNTLGIHFFLEKGTSSKDNGYSVFESSTFNVSELLHKYDIAELYVCGLATDFCVKATVLDALRNGFTTFVITDCIRAVNRHEGDGVRALNEMQQHGAILVQSNAIRPK